MWELRLRIGPGAILLWAAMLHISTCEVTGIVRKTQVFVNQTSSSLILSKSWNFRSWTQLSFRTCSFNGELLSQEDSTGQYLNLHLNNGSLVFSWNISNIAASVSVQGKYNTNKWVTVSLKFFLGEVYFNVTQGRTVLYSSIIASLTTNQYLLMHNVNSVELKVGRTIVGCINQGPSVDFNLALITATNVIWNNCSVSSSLGCTLADLDGNDCISLPCQNAGTCQDGINTYTCLCPHNFNGTNCETDLRQYGCSISPCLNSGTCVSVSGNPARPYSCTCANGYTGSDCELVIDHCQSQPCLHSGVCSNNVGDGYKCNCTGTGYEGINCQTDINECDTVSCGAGTCYDSPGGFACQCPVGYNGDRCEDNIDECVSSPCRNDGQCNNELGQFSCTCQSGFTGIYCEVNIDDCQGVLCQSPNATCKDLVNNHQCVCKDGFTGTDPDCIDINECASNPCVQTQTIQCDNLINKYHCQCKPGYTGDRCEIDIDECQIDPCQNNATCVQDINSYRCNCLPGYNGKNCSNNINDCLPNTCQNGGSCTDLINDYKCDCITGWTSKDCSVNYNDCASNPCLNNATCHDYLNYYNCSCLTGFRGDRCEENINDCINNPCNNNGQCQDLTNDYRCDCTSLWMGKNCSQTYDACIDLSPCQNGATCNTEPPSRSYQCNCVVGFTNTNCSVNIDDCILNNCSSFQQCYDGINSFTCGCPPGFEGPLCDIDIDECAGNKCQNDAKCINGTGDYTCECQLTFYNLTQYVPGKLEFYSGYKGKYCTEDIDECQYAPCLNGGNCNNNNGSFICYCPGGKLTTGSNCELLTTYCDVEAGKLGRPPCQNGGTCKSSSRGFDCACAPGWHGGDCSLNINECESDPCQNMGTCLDGINGYNCSCIPGITGANCEINIDECNSDPCLNGGHCLDQINQYICNCSDTGFKGNNCETNIDDCIGDPCLHGGTCLDGIKDYTCNCYGGYSGKNCDFDIKECETKPCQYGGTCLERSNQTLYELNIDGFSNFSYATAAGYKCFCIPGITGTNCDVNIDECLSGPCLNGATCIDDINRYSCGCAPGYEGTHCELDINECERYRACQNGAQCTDLIADYQCDCLPHTLTIGGYGGKNCSVRLIGCDSQVLCDRGSSCIPNYNELTGRHDYTCDCLNGYTGRYCNISTTFTLQKDAVVSSSSPQTVEEVSFRFRTSLDEGILMSYQPASQSEFLIIQIQEMKLKIELTNHVSMMMNSIAVNDGYWHDVKITLQDNITVSLDSSLCHQVSDCTIKFPTFPTASSQQGDLYFGSSVTAVLATRAAYIGCMQDVLVNNKAVIDTDPNYFFSPTTIKGCPRKEQCGPYTCDRHGDCKDLWYTYQCDCYRPYLGTNCTDEFVPATFAKDNTTSFASFLVPQDLKSVLENAFEFSLFVQTRQENSVIMYIGNTDGSRLTFLTLEMIGGKLGGRISFCNIRDSFLSKQLYQDGRKHFVNLSVKSGIFSFSVQSDVVNKTINNSGTCPLNASIFFVGGRTPSFSESGRKKREVFDANSITDFSSTNNFEGIIQDIEINKQKFEFFPKTSSSQIALSISNVTEGGVSTRDVCQDQPCENGGTCFDIVYNDFRCECPKGYIGKNCSALDFCKTNSCPADAICQSRTDGFECIAASSFNGRNSLLKYRPNILNTTQLNTLSFHLITHSQYSTIFYLRHGNKFIKVRLVDGHVQLNYKLTNEMSSFLDLRLPVNDGEWYVVEVEFVVNSLTLRTKQNDTILEEETRSVINLDITAMVKDGAELFLGGTGPSSFPSRWEQSYKGCLNEVRLGSVLLPFFNDNLFINNTSQEKFIVQMKQSIVIGCDNGDSCLQDGAMCLHGSNCQNIWNGFQCQCLSGFEGKYCQSNRDECPTIICGKGRCIDGIGKATCQCPKNSTGNRCQTDVDFCTNDSCDNNGSCYELNHDFGCNCSEDLTGKTCNILKNSTCSEGPCKNNGICSPQTPTDGAESFNCSCQSGYQGTTCEVIVDNCGELPCQNGGNCTVDLTKPDLITCSCPDGFDGSKCENNKDNCSLGVCKNNGICEDLVNDYHCNCTEGWKGRNCDVNIDECNETLPCQQHGSCIDTPGSYICNCTGSGYNGSNCADEVDECNLPAPPCKNNAGCTNTEGGYECNCTIGYSGTDCNVPSCSDNQCINNSTCTITNNKWKCNCMQFYYGKVCETAGPCTNNYCSSANTVSCSQNEADFTYTCHCKQGWKGPNCTEDVNECDITPCMNGGICNNTVGSYECNCVLGYTGDNCTINIDDCQNKCQNNGTCTDLVNGFRCQCTDAYSGKTCEKDVNECKNDIPICQNNQSCENIIGSYICQCTDEYLGKNCEYKNPCMNLKCENGALCNKTYIDDRYEAICDCVKGFEGVLCEKAGPSVQPVDESVNIWVIIGPIIAIIIIAVIIGVVVFLVTARNKRATRGQYCPSQQETAGARVELGNVLKRPPAERLI